MIFLAFTAALTALSAFGAGVTPVVGLRCVGAGEALKAGGGGFAGDRGFLHPELTAAATAPEAAQVAAAGGDAHLCSNRTCEIGMARATGRSYESFVYLLERLSR